MTLYRLTITSLFSGRNGLGLLQLPVLNAHGTLVRHIKFHERVDENSGPKVEFLELEHGETFGQSFVTGSCSHNLEIIPQLPRLPAGAPMGETRDYWREQAVEAQAEAVELRADLADADRVIWGLSAIAIIGWGLTIALAAGWL